MSPDQAETVDANFNRFLGTKLTAGAQMFWK